MIKYFTKYRKPAIQFNTETEEMNELPYMCTHVDWMYRIPEDGIFTMEGKTAEVKKNDIVVKFYEKVNNPFIVITNPEWIETIDKYEAEVAKQKTENDECENCACCKN